MGSSCHLRRRRSDALSRCAAGARSFGLAAISLSDTHGVIAAVSNIPYNGSGSSESRCTAPTQTRQRSGPLVYPESAGLRVYRAQGVAAARQTKTHPTSFGSRIY